MLFFVVVGLAAGFAVVLGVAIAAVATVLIHEKRKINPRPDAVATDN